jgi:Double zinc ribbon
MSRFRTELRVVPATAWVIAAIVYLAAAFAAGAMNWEKARDAHDPEPIWAFSLLVALVPLVPVAWVLLIGYVNGDARRRGMRHSVWTLLAIFTPSGIGVILYFLFREPLLRSCPSCSVGNKAGRSYCPNCGYALGRLCPGCNRPVDEGWKNCTHCGVTL